MSAINGFTIVLKENISEDKARKIKEALTVLMSNAKVTYNINSDSEYITKQQIKWKIKERLELFISDNL